MSIPIACSQRNLVQFPAMLVAKRLSGGEGSLPGVPASPLSLHVCVFALLHLLFALVSFFILA